jgi:hypothetical protein
MTDAKRQANSNVVRMALRPLKMGAKSEKSLAALQ